MPIMSENTIPKTMRGVQMTRTGGPEVLKYRTDLPVPTPQASQVLVKNEFIGINYVDVYWRIGMMGNAPDGVIGREAEGTIIATGSGDLHGLKLGDRVGYIAIGAYAEYTAVPAGTAYPIPSQLKPGFAAASMMQGFTALNLTERVIQVTSGDWVLVHAAAGGIGLWLCQILKGIGARTIGTVSTAEKMQLARDNGAEFVLNYKEDPDIESRIKEITGGRGVAVVYDSVGKDQTQNNVEVVADHGTIVTYGASSGIPVSLDDASLNAKRVRFVGPAESAVMRSIGSPEEFGNASTRLFDLLTTGLVNVRIHDTYSLPDIARTHQDLEARKTTGKLLVEL